LSGGVFARVATGVGSSALICAVLIVTAGAVGVTQQSAGQLNVCHAGRVQLAFTAVENAFKAEHPSVAVNDVSGGSVALAGRLAAGLQPCDVYAAADYLAVDLLLKPLGLAEYTIVFAKGRMVLRTWRRTRRRTGSPAPRDFKPPAAIPHAVPDWYKVLLAPGVRISSSHPYLELSSVSRSQPVGLETITRMAARPFSCPQRMPAAVFVLFSLSCDQYARSKNASLIE
jgi:ABC-type molybdate transport system substrate-binding protein